MANPDPGFFTGKKGSITLTRTTAIWGGSTNNATSLPLDKWSFSADTDAINVDNFQSSGFNQNEDGFTTGKISASGPFNNTVVVSNGDLGTFALAIGGTGITISCTARVTSVKIDQDAKGVARIDYEAETCGPWSVAQ
jgi:hypothetical protein